MKSTVLNENGIGTIMHARSIKVGDRQSIVFLPTDLPPIFHSDVPKYDIVKESENVIQNLTKAEIKLESEELGINNDRNMNTLRVRAQESNVSFTKIKGKVFREYVGKPKRAAQIVCNQRFLDLNRKLTNSKTLAMSDAKVTNPLTGVVSVNKETGTLIILKQFGDFRNKQTQMMFILNLLNILL